MRLEQLQNLSEMLASRGFLLITPLPEIGTEGMFKFQALSSIRKVMQIIVLKFAKSGVKEVRMAMEHCNDHKTILIFSRPLTTFASREIEQNPRKDIEIWMESEFMFNPTKHFLCPKHEIMSSASKKEFLESRKIEASLLPKMSVNDPIMKYYGARKGNLIRITRPNPGGFTYYAYRLVI